MSDKSYYDKLPRDLKNLLLSGLDYREIQGLCATSKPMNEAICRNENFYRALMKRDFGNWKFPHTPESILALEDAEEVEIEHNVSVYVSTYRKSPMHFHTSAFQYARLPGTGNTVKINDEDYIWYYFMWAPKDHPLVNMSLKTTDKELEKMFDLEPFGFIKETKRQYPISVGALSPIFKVSHQRWSLFLFNRGILYETNGNEIDWNRLDTADDYDSQQLYEWSLFSINHVYDRLLGDRVRNLRHVDILTNVKHWVQFLKPRTLQDLTLEYYDEGGASFAFSAQLLGREKGIDAVTMYKNLLEKYQIMRQLDEFAAKVGKSRRPIMLDKCREYLRRMASEHEWSPLVIFPSTDSFWPKELHVRIVHLIYQIQDRINKIYDENRTRRDEMTIGDVILEAVQGPGQEQEGGQVQGGDQDQEN